MILQQIRQLKVSICALVYTVLHAFSESHVTSSSSRLPSSDTLSALPQRVRMSFVPQGLISLLRWRGHRRSLDASTSLPFSPTADLDSRVLGHNVQGTTPIFNARTESNSNSGILERHSTPEKTPKQSPLTVTVRCQLCIALDKVRYTRASFMFILEAHNYLQHFRV